MTKPQRHKDIKTQRHRDTKAGLIIFLKNKKFSFLKVDQIKLNQIRENLT